MCGFFPLCHRFFSSLHYGIADQYMTTAIGGGFLSFNKVSPVWGSIFFLRRTLMIKKFFSIMTVLLLGASLFFSGCDTPTNGVNGDVGSKGPIYLSGNMKTAGINHAIASGAPLVFAGVVQSDTGRVIIPAGRKVELVGSTAYTANSAAAGILIVAAKDSVTGNGGLAIDAAGVIIAPEGVFVSAGTPVRIQEGSDDIDYSQSIIAVTGKDVTLSSEATDDENINVTNLAAKTLYVLDGTVTASAVLGAATIFVDGNATVDTIAQTAAVNWGYPRRP
jgi:hypothetical protein